MKARLFLLSAIAALVFLAPASGQQRPHALCASAVAADGEPTRAEVERDAVAILAASSLGACSCSAPLEPDGTCATQDSATRLCAASVVERIGEATILALRHGADERRMQALKACLVEARLQLQTGSQAPGESGRDWAPRRAIGLAASGRLIAEIDSELNRLSDEELRLSLEAWLKQELSDRREAFLKRYPPLGVGAAACPALSAPSAEWDGLPVRDQVNCFLKAIAATHADNTDHGSPQPGVPRDPPLPQACAPQEGGGVDPTCCMASEAQLAGEEELGAYEFSRGKDTFRTSMTRFCREADRAGLLEPDRRPQGEAPKLEIAEALAALEDAPPSLTPDQIRALLAPLAEAEAQARWRAALEKSEAYETATAAEIEAEMQSLAVYFQSYLDQPNGREYLLNGAVNQQLTLRMLEHHACFKATGAACRDEGKAQ